MNIGAQSVSRSKHPSTTPGNANSKLPATKKTPGKPATSKTPKDSNQPGTSYDRFIPNRALMDMNRSHHILMRDNEENSTMEEQDTDDDYSEKMKKNLGASESKILAMRCKAPASSDGHMSKVLYSQNKSSAAKWKSTRHIPNTPERILDAPDITNDYYLNLLDWGSNNCISVALGNSVFVWNSGTGIVEKLIETEEDNIITSVRWIKEGDILAVGFNNGSVELWDAATMKKMRTMTGHGARVGALAWNSFILTSGSRTGAIHQHDVRVPRHHIASLMYHTQEVCGLEWSPNETTLASGGNDNVLAIWNINLQSSGEINNPTHCLTEHQAAVKALAWCPWQPHILASGGGSADRHIRTWNATTGVCLQSTDTKSQVSGIIWSEEHKEIISAHGYSENQLSIWKYPSMTKVKELTGHTARVLSIAESPDHSVIASASADETIRMWKCFSTDKKKLKGKAKPQNIANMPAIGGGIR